MMLYVCILAAIYALTVKLGLLGNAWVIQSVLRSRRPNNMLGKLTPSDRLRTYIGILAVVDLLVIGSLLTKIVYIALPHASTDDLSCRVIFITDRLVKFASLTTLACISIERFITIRKPFNSRIRRRFIRLTPLVALCFLFSVLCAISVLAFNVSSTDGGTDCVHSNSENIGVKVARWIVGVGFLLQLFVISTNYGQIIRHVRHKFWERKARVVANSRSISKQPLVSEPLYLRKMTTAIVRIACFHVICWLPFIVIQLWNFGFTLTNSLRMFEEDSQITPLTWALFIADWLTYLNSALDWILYAAMNRDLRNIIRDATERRKRSTMSNGSPSNLHKSLRRQLDQGLRFFYSINSYKSRGNSFDDSLTTCNNGGNGSFDSNSSPLTVARSVSTSAPATEGLFGMRNNRAHTYCSPKSSCGLSQGSGQGPIGNGLNAQKFIAMMQTGSPTTPQRPLLASIFRSNNKSNNCPERFV